MLLRYLEIYEYLTGKEKRETYYSMSLNFTIMNYILKSSIETSDINFRSDPLEY